MDGTAWVIGVVVGPDGKPLDDVNWTVSRAARTDTEDLASGATGTDGVFASCKTNNGDDIVVRFTRRGMGSGFVTRHLDAALTVIHPQMTPEKRR